MLRNVACIIFHILFYIAGKKKTKQEQNGWEIFTGKPHELRTVIIAQLSAAQPHPVKFRSNNLLLFDMDIRTKSFLSMLEMGRTTNSTISVLQGKKDTVDQFLTATVLQNIEHLLKLIFML